MIIEAVVDDLQRLTEIAIESKAYWGYTAEQIDSWREDLTVSLERFEQWEIYKFVSEDEIAGFYCLDLRGEEAVELEFLFVLPKFIGKAIGRQLLQHAFNKANGRPSMNVLSDPNAATFYAKYGFVEKRLHESSIPGRFLPVMEKVLQ